MGQMTYGLCYGIPLDRKTLKIKGLEDSERLLEKYTAANDAKIRKLAKRTSYWQAASQVCPHWNGEGTGFLGFFIAAGASGKDGLPYLEGFCLATLDSNKRYTKPMRAAANAWAKFSDWCEARQILLPEPHLWLVECEVA
jgi:hypothetical protein